MRSYPWRLGLGAFLLAGAASGCGNSPPGEGLTNGPAPTVLRAEEKPGIRDDLRDASAPAIDTARTVNAGPAHAGGGGGESGGQRAGSADTTPEPSGQPPTKDAPHDSGAAGATKPRDNIQTGTPRSPQ